MSLVEQGTVPPVSDASRRAFLLLGSPKPSGSASAALATAVTTRLEALGWDVRTDRATRALGDSSRETELLEAIAASEVVLLVFPVYVDALPAPVLRVLELWRDALASGAVRPEGRQRLAVLTQCGFPEARHCEVAVEVCRLFAEQVGVEWAGALAFGMGPSVSGGSIDRSPLARALPELGEAVSALARGHSIPASATAAFARPLGPPWAYPLVGGFVWSRLARKQGCSEPLTLRRYAQ